MSHENIMRLWNEASVNGEIRPKIRIITKTSNYTVTPGDFGSVFTTRGATSQVTFTLPAASTVNKGEWNLFINAADVAMFVAGAASGLVIFNDLTADNIGFSTSGELIGGMLLAISDGTSWIVLPIATETQTIGESSSTGTSTASSSSTATTTSSATGTSTTTSSATGTSTATPSSTGTSTATPSSTGTSTSSSSSTATWSISGSDTASHTQSASATASGSSTGTSTSSATSTGTSTSSATSTPTGTTTKSSTPTGTTTSSGTGTSSASSTATATATP